MTKPDSTGRPPDALRRMIQHLANVGLNLFACLSGHELLEQQIAGIKDLQRQAREMGGRPLEQQTVVLVGNSGPSFWAALQDSAFAHRSDPVDQFSQHLVAEALHQHLPDLAYRLLYPLADCPIALQELGRLAGWHRSSPLGIGMHPQAGLWYAYRALVLVDVNWPGLESTAFDLVTDHCERCETQDCISVCPPQALVLGQTPDLLRCCEFRVASDSPCEEQCLARNACPVFPEKRYSQEQIRHHYLASLDSLRRYIQQDQGDV